jgi:hypothetical protein
MSNLVAEVLLRIAKAVAAAIVGLIVWALLVGVGGAAPSAELALLAWLSGAAFVLLVESSPL